MDDRRDRSEDDNARRTRSAAILATGAIGALMAGFSLLPRSPAFVWNISSSIPAGLYRVEPGMPQRGDILVIRPSGAPEALLKQAGALDPDHLLLKPLAGLAGDVVCRRGATVTLNGKAVAVAQMHGGAAARLPVWSGCRRLGPDECLVLAANPRSFDSRYFGPIKTDQIIGLARPVLTFASEVEAR